MSHTKSVTAALYNPLFNQVVSGAADSTVIVWNMVSGHRVMQFRVTPADRVETDSVEVSTSDGIGILKAHNIMIHFRVERDGSAVKFRTRNRALVRIPCATVAKFGHLCSLHDAPVQSAV